MKERQPLRFLILADSLVFRRWETDCLREVIASGLAIPVAVVVNGSRQSSSNKWRIRWRNRRLLLWRMFNRFYVDRFSKATTPATVDELHTLPHFTEIPGSMGRFGQVFSQEAITFVNNMNPDFILRLGFGILKGEILKSARFGVWSYHHGDPTKFRGQPPGFWEIYSGSSVTGTVLQVLTEELDAGTVLHSGYFQTTHQSYVKTRDTIYLGSSPWVRRTCAAIQENGWPLKTEPFLASAYKAPICKQPKNSQMVLFLFKTVLNFFKSQWTYRAFVSDWTCGVVPEPIHVIAGLNGPDEQLNALERTQWLKCPPHCFVADPFGYKVGDSQIRIVCELFDKRKNIGAIASTAYNAGEFSRLDVILQSSAHFSYPFVLRDEEDVYIIPEHAEAGSICAFRLSEGGKVEEQVTILPNNRLLDPTIVSWNGKYWLFALDDSNTKNTSLNLYFADHWRGPWLAHPLNPVKTDVRSSRPAGTPFLHEGKLYRPSQDCSTHYGSATVISEVVELTEATFVERPVARVQPRPNSSYPHGLHTLSAVGPLTLIDAARKSSRWRDVFL